MARMQETVQGMREKAQEAAKGVTEKAKEAGSQALHRADQMTSTPMRVQEQIPSKLYMAAVAGSILASMGLMLAGRSQGAIFVGLWAPTILNMALFYKLIRPSQEPMTGQGYAGAGSYGTSASYGTAEGYGTGSPTGAAETGQ